ncbi:MAG: hypothetical protein HYZ75_01610 [Elusimicrobia bacterium]|nr:hypothetical protein [Elusimicrobiota bacterium]
MRLTLTLCLALLSSPVAAAAPDIGDLEDTAVDAPLPAVLPESYAAAVVGDAALNRALHALYSLNYSTGEAEAESFIAGNPDNPYGELFISGMLWWRASTELLRSVDDPALALSFDRHSRLAVVKSKRLFKAAQPRLRAEAFFVAGMSYGLRGQWRLTNRQWLKAYLDGKKAIKHLRRCVEVDPLFHDAYLGLGIFDYQSAVLPGVLRIGALLLVRGNRERGLARIRQAMEKGQFARQQAAQFLLTILMAQEKDSTGALALLRELRKDFPESVYYAGVEAAMLAASGDRQAAVGAWAAVYAQLAAEDAFDSKGWAVLCGAYADACLVPERATSAEAWIQGALNSPPPSPPPGWESALHLVRGLARDSRRHAAGAREDYNAVAADPAAPPALKRIAEACRVRPCVPERIIALNRSRQKPTP